MSGPGKTPSSGRRWLLLAVVLIVIVAGAILLSQVSARAAPDQPINFDHGTHRDAGVQCLFCHPNPLRSNIAGIPSVARCVGCHRTIATDRPEIQKVIGYWERRQPIPWVQVQAQPDHVFFSHQPHIRSGLTCETCHGDVSKMTVVHPVFKMDMGWCLTCHQEQPDEKVARLSDCLTCHK